MKGNFYLLQKRRSRWWAFLGAGPYLVQGRYKTDELVSSTFRLDGAGAYAAIILYMQYI